MNGIIYCATFLNGRIYVGQTIQTLEARKSQHRWHAEHFKDNFIFHQAIRKYGFDAITWEILEENILDLQTLKQREIFWIKEKNSYNKLNRLGCNMTPGGDDRSNLFKYTEEDVSNMVKRYIECGNSSIIGKEFNTNSSVVMRYIKVLLPDYQVYSYNKQGQRSIFTLEKKYEIYNYYIFTGSVKDTQEKYNVKSRTLSRILSSIDNDYYKKAWKGKISKIEALQMYEDFKQQGRLEPFAKKYNLTISSVREVLKKIDPKYTQYTKRK